MLNPPERSKKNKSETLAHAPPMNLFCQWTP
jgi:hypothetical protein